VTRIIAGGARGRRLVVPPGTGTRPTSDRAREALFSSLAALRGPLSKARVLDLYAGSGALGLEALSRGAAHALLVESERSALAAIRANVEALGLPGAEVKGALVERVVGAPNSGAPYDIAFLDPPYATPATQVGQVLTDLAANAWLAAGAVVVVERPTREAPWIWPAGYAADRDRAYGEATLWYGHAASATQHEE